MRATSEAETTVRKAEKILLGIDRIFLAGGTSSPSPDEAAELIQAGESVLGELRRLAEEVKEPSNALLQLIGSLKSSISLAKEEIDDEA